MFGQVIKMGRKTNSRRRTRAQIPWELLRFLSTNQNPLIANTVFKNRIDILKTDDFRVNFYLEIVSSEPVDKNCFRGWIKIIDSIALYSQ